MPDTQHPGTDNNLNKAPNPPLNKGQQQQNIHEYFVEPMKEIDIREIFNVLNRRKYGIIFLLIISVALSWLFHKAEEPAYYAESIILIDSPFGINPVDAALGTTGEADAKAVKKDVELLTSMPITQLAVRELLKTTKRDSLEFFGKRHYRSSFDDIITLMSPFADKRSAQTMSLNGPEYPDDFIRSSAIKLSYLIKVDPVRETSLIKVSVKSPFQDEAVYLTNTLCTAYKNADINRKSEKYKQSSSFIAEMLHNQQKFVAQTDSTLSRYMESNKMYEGSGNVGQLLSKVTEIESKVNELKTESRITQNSLDFLQSKLTEADRILSSRIAKTVNAKLSAILEDIKNQQKQYVQLIAEKGVDDADTKNKKQQLDAAQSRYENLSRSQIAGEINYTGRTKKYSFDLIAEKLETERKLNLLSNSAIEYDKLKQSYEGKVNLLPKKQQDYAKLQRDRDVAGKTYTFLKEKLDESRILLGSEVGNVSIIGSAFRPFFPANASPLKSMLIGLLVGGLLASIYTLISEYLDDSIKDETVLKNQGFTVLSQIPFVTNMPNGSKATLGNYIKQTDTLSTDQLGTVPLITDRLSSWYAESFRTLRTAISYCSIDNPIRSLIVSGVSIAEGKSSVCTNLGMALALNGRRVIIIDCDLRLASQHNIFKIKREVGLTDYLYSDLKTIDDSFIKSTHVANLSVITAGKKIPNPNEFLSSQKMQDLILDLETKFDIVLIDSPPLFLSDAAQLAQTVDGILIAARLNHTPRKPLKDLADDHLIFSNIIGVALIGSLKNSYGYGKYGHHKYGYGNRGSYYGQN